MIDQFGKKEFEAMSDDELIDNASWAYQDYRPDILRNEINALLWAVKDVFLDVTT